MFASARPSPTWLYPSQQDLRLNHSSKRPRYSTDQSSQAVILHHSVPHKARTPHRQLTPYNPPKLKGIIRMPSRSDYPKTPKKKVRFADEAKTESDRVWKTPSKKAADYKRPSTPKSPRKRHSAHPVLVTAGLSAVAVGLGAATRSPHRSSRPRTLRRRDRVEQPRTPRTPTKRREERRKERPREEREAKKPRVVYGQNDVLGADYKWATVRRRYTYYWN